MTNKRRLSASVEAQLIEVGLTAVSEGRSENLSAWVNDALRLKADDDRRLRALDDFIARYEAEHSEITEAEMVESSRRARARAIVVRGAPGTDEAPPARRGRGAA